MKNRFSGLYKRHIRTIPGIKSYVLATIFVFLLGVIITLLSWYVDKQRVENLQDLRISDQAAAFERDIKNRLSVYEQILRGASGLFGASEAVSRDEWRRFVGQYDLENTYPGVSGIGYVEHVRSDELAGYQSRLQAEGTPVQEVIPPGERAEYGPITYLEPFDQSARRAIGFDVLTDPLRLKTAHEARDSGKVKLSGKSVLIGDRGQSNQASFVMYLAAYRNNENYKTIEERRSALEGYIFAGYRANQFFDKAIDKSNFAAYSAVRVFDGRSIDGKDILYESGNFNQFDQTKLSTPFEITVLDHPWTFQFAGPRQTSAQDAQRSNMILIGGTTISFAIAGFLFLVMLTRARAIVYSKQNEAQQAKDDLLSLASHQLRTPATAVKQYLGMILEGYTGEIDERQAPAIQKAYASNERQLDTINQILYVAKADAGRLSINKMPFDMNLLIDDIALDLEDMLEAKNQKIVVERSAKKLKINADESSLRMVIENLISNASKYSFENSKITIKTGIKNDEIFVSITDRGVGIAPHDFDKLFKKFSRIDNDLSLQVGGTGIGLYIDKVLVELHGGRIEVESEHEKGSTFTIYLPKNSANNLTDGDNDDKSV